MRLPLGAGNVVSTTGYGHEVPNLMTIGMLVLFGAGALVAVGMLVSIAVGTNVMVVGAGVGERVFFAVGLAGLGFIGDVVVGLAMG